MDSKRYFAHGKLLLTGEYLVLKGAKALAVPTARGQHLEVTPTDQNIEWNSCDHEGKIWFSATFDSELQLLECSDEAKALFLQKLLVIGQKLSGTNLPPARLTTSLDFPRSWGLGTSSTLTYLLASWLKIDPFKLFFATQNGSGYDIACAGASKPLIYRLEQGRPSWDWIDLPPVFQNTYFIHLNQKQQSHQEVENFKKQEASAKDIEAISLISEQFLKVQSSSDLMGLIDQHEKIMSRVLARPSIKETLFPGFKGTVKSLGAWGGDFVMAIGEDVNDYFRSKSYHTILSFKQLVIEKPQAK